MHSSCSQYSVTRHWHARTALLAVAIVANGCAAQRGPALRLAVGEDACSDPALVGQVLTSHAECLMQRRQAYEQALGQLSVQVLR